MNGGIFLASYFVKTFKYLPCELEVFTINGMNADRDDFGNIVFNGGSCMDNECGCEFEIKDPTNDILIKYNLSENEYFDVAHELACELNVFGCGACS